MIYSERLRLRAPERTDIPRFVAWLNDPEVTRTLAMNLPRSTADEEEWFNRMQASPGERHPLVIEIPEGEDWKPIGVCGFDEIDRTSRHGEVGIFIGEKSCWDQGYGTETMRLLLKHGF